MAKSKWEHRIIEAKDDKEFVNLINEFEDYRLIRIIPNGYKKKDGYSVSVKI